MKVPHFPALEALKPSPTTSMTSAPVPTKSMQESFAWTALVARMSARPRSLGPRHRSHEVIGALPQAPVASDPERCVPPPADACQHKNLSLDSFLKMYGNRSEFRGSDG